MSGHLQPDTTPLLIAKRLTRSAIQQISQVEGGRNSRVYRVETVAGLFALKLYPPQVASDRRSRLEVETTALAWMERAGFTMVPRVLASDPAHSAALLSWAEGNLVRGDVGAADVAQACAFLALLHERRANPALPPDSLAAEACLSGAEIERQLRLRMADLKALADPSLSAFLAGEAEPMLAACLSWATSALTAAGSDFGQDLAQARRSQVPSDFGFHNALRDAAGRLTFIDFEYFGWDDPVKLVADILLHPGTPIDEATRARLRAGATEIYGEDPGFEARLAALLPLFGLRWGLILLNEFHPERWRRRVMAGATGTWDDAKQRQLAAARDMLARYARAPMRTT